jgi:hypothetical protein
MNRETGDVLADLEPRPAAQLDRFDGHGIKVVGDGFFASELDPYRDPYRSCFIRLMRRLEVVSERC